MDFLKDKIDGINPPALEKPEPGSLLDKLKKPESFGKETTENSALDKLSQPASWGESKREDNFKADEKIPEGTANMPTDLPDMPTDLPDMRPDLPIGIPYNILPSTGEWEGEKGNGTWIPDGNTIPDPENRKQGNPDKLTWEEILRKYGIDGIPFKDGYPDFSEVRIASVEIDNFTTDRSKNFAQADEKLAEQWTKEKKDGKEWTAEDVKQWRKENGYTWHEHQNCKTMELVPQEIHNNTPHSGGISEAKKTTE